MRRRAAAPVAAVIVHDLAQANAALAAALESGRPIAVWSAPEAAIYAGIGWFAAVERRARAANPKAPARFVLDCGERADLVQEAFREGIEETCFTGRASLAERLADIAAQSHAKLHRRRPRALDLDVTEDPRAACRRLLGGG
jgi:fructose/tagatose bisphosphate aldolase